MAPAIGPGVGAGFTRRRRGAGGGEPVTIPVLEPSASWVGWTAWSAGNTGLDAIAPPAVDGTMRGSGWTQPPIARHNGWDYRRITDPAGELILVGAYTGDPTRNGIEKVVAHLEGSTVESTVPIYDAPSGLWGFPFRVRAPAGKGGVARLVVDVYPWNGPVLRIPGPHGANGFPIILDTDPAITFRTARPVRFLNPVTGSDANNGLTAGTAWRSAKYAMSQATSDMLVNCADGDTDESGTASTGPNTLLAPMELRGTGTATACRLSKNINTDQATGGVLRTSDDAGNIRLRCNLVKFSGMRFDPSKFVVLTQTVPSFNNNPTAIYENCVAVDSLSITTPGAERIGPECGYYAADTAPMFADADGQRHVSAYSTWLAYWPSGLCYSLGGKVTAAADAFIWAPWRQGGGPTISGTYLRMAELVKTRHSAVYPATVSSFVATGVDIGSGANLKRVVITLSGSPAMAQGLTLLTSTTSNDYGLEFLTGPLVGNEYKVLAVDTAAKTVSVYDPADVIATNIANGHTFRSWVYVHPDSFQSGIDGSGVGGGFQGVDWLARNILLENTFIDSVDNQNWFLSSRGQQGRGTLNTTGTAGTISGVTKTVQSVTLTGGRTVITWTDAVQIPAPGANDRNTTPLRFLTGTLAGQDRAIYSSNGTNTTTLHGDHVASIAPGDTATPWQFTVGDFIQRKAAGTGQFEYRRINAMSGPLSFTLDAAFPIDLVSITSWAMVKTIRNMAIVGTQGTLPTSGGNFESQFCAGFENLLIANNTNLQTFRLRNNLTAQAGIGFRDVTVIDNILGAGGSDVAFGASPPRGMIIDNNHFVSTNSLGGTNNVASAGGTFDAALRPTGVSKTKINSPRTGRPVVPFRPDGTAAQAGDAVGAVQP